MPAQQKARVDSKKKRLPRKKLVLLAGSLVLFMLVGEVGIRVRQWIKYGSGGNALYESEYHETSGLIVPTAGQKTKTIKISSAGFRGPELSDPKPEASVRVAFIGGSTTFCAEASGNEKTWPHLVCDALQERWETLPFEYLNAAVPGYAVDSSIKNLAHRVKATRPDVIVIYHAINDLSKDTRRLAEEKGVWKGNVDEKSALAEVSLLWDLVEKNLRSWSRSREAAGGKDRLTYDAKKLAGGFRERMSKLVAMAKEVAPVVCLVTFSHHGRRDQSEDELLNACNTSLYYMPYMSPAGILDGVEAYNDVIRQVAREANVVIVDDATRIPGDDAHFSDSVHLKDKGCGMMADLVAKILIAAEPLTRLVEERAKLLRNR